VTGAARVGSALLLGAAVVACTRIAPAQAAGASDPIVGEWRSGKSVELTIRSTGPRTFEATLLRAYPACPGTLRAGTVDLRDIVRQPDGHYAAQNLWWSDESNGTCTRFSWTAVVLHFLNRNTISLCGVSEYDNRYECGRLTRIVACPTPDDTKLLARADDYLDTLNAEGYQKYLRPVLLRYKAFVRAVKAKKISDDRKIAEVNAHTPAYYADLARAYLEDVARLRAAYQQWRGDAECAGARAEVEDRWTEGTTRLEHAYKVDRVMPSFAIRSIRDHCGCMGF
jgi:hypothetical protein